MVLMQVFTNCDWKPASAACWVAHDIGRPRLDQFHHQLNLVPRRAELSVMASRGDFSKHVLLQVPFGIAIRPLTLRGVYF